MKQAFIRKGIMYSLIFCSVIPLSLITNDIIGLENSYTSYQINDETVDITDFSDFVIDNECENITSTQSDENIFFNKSGSRFCDYSDFENYVLFLDQFGNVSDCEIELALSYLITNPEEEYSFAMRICTKYNSTSNDYSNNYNRSFCSISIEKLYDDNSINFGLYYSYNWDYKHGDVLNPNFDTIKFHIIKKGTNLLLEVLTIDNEVLTNYKWNSYSSYMNVQMLELYFFGYNTSDFTVNTTSISATFELGYRKWWLLERRDQILTSLLVIIPSILAIITIYLIVKEVRKKINKRRSSKLSKIEKSLYEFDKRQVEFRESKIDQLRVDRKKIDETNCGICKLPILKDKIVLQCPECKTYFHQNHLKDWLEKFEKCPICKKQLLDKK